jgi:hypothetical protein
LIASTRNLLLLLPLLLLLHEPEQTKQIEGEGK